MKNNSFIVFLYLCLGVLVFCLALPLCSGSDVQSLGFVKQNSPILLKQNCVNVTYVNITSIASTGTISKELLSSPVAMNLIANGYQTYNFTNTSFLGDYIVTGICNQNGVPVAWSYTFTVTPTGVNFSGEQISIYIFFLVVCFLIILFSYFIIKKNTMITDLSYEELYEIKKRNEFIYLIELLKRKLWIVGVIGIYLSITLFAGLLTQLVYSLGLTDLSGVINNFTIILLWGLIPLIIFFLVYIIIVFFQTTTRAMKYQFGGFLRSKK